jgi:hypothetical protein
MDNENIAKSLRTAKQLNQAFINAKDQDHDAVDEPETAPDGSVSFTMYQMVGGERPGAPPQGQWVTKVTVASEWHPFDDE